MTSRLRQPRFAEAVAPLGQLFVCHLGRKSRALDLDLGRQPVDLRGVDQARAEVLGRLGAAGDAVDRQSSTPRPL